MSGREHEESDDAPSQSLSHSEEQRVLHAALDSFRQYRQAAHYNVTHLRRQSFYSMPSKHIDLLSEPPFSMQKTFEAVDDAIDHNADLAEAILEAGLPFSGIDAEDESWIGKATPNDMDKTRSTIRQFYRDWSAEAAVERHASHSPILDALRNYLPSSTTSEKRVLVPGAGLSRLLLDICAAGYLVEGNEISHHQLLASYYVLNSVKSANQHEIFPWALEFSNHAKHENQVRSVHIPDILPGTALQERLRSPQAEGSDRGPMSMTAGDFCSLYKELEYEGMFDAVATCFFIDTAPNVIRYVETIKHSLKQDGLWVNLGPLLWHFEAEPTPAERQERRANSLPNKPQSNFEGIGEPGSIELSNQEVVALVEIHGFEMLEQSLASAGAAGYIQDMESMLQSVYRPAFWVARKK